MFAILKPKTPPYIAIAAVFHFYLSSQAWSGLFWGNHMGVAAILLFRVYIPKLFEIRPENSGIYSWKGEP
jgi:hypothetical protein